MWCPSDLISFVPCDLRSRMVKVLLFSLFGGHQVLQSELEPVDTTVVADDVFLIATKEGGCKKK